MALIDDARLLANQITHLDRYGSEFDEGVVEAAGRILAEPEPEPARPPDVLEIMNETIRERDEAREREKVVALAERIYEGATAREVRDTYAGNTEYDGEWFEDRAAEAIKAAQHAMAQKSETRQIPFQDIA